VILDEAVEARTGEVADLDIDEGSPKLSSERPKVFLSLSLLGIPSKDRLLALSVLDLAEVLWGNHRPSL
jgi:hypothetical protein